MSAGPAPGPASDRLWKSSEPCYSKVSHSAVVALGISTKGAGVHGTMSIAEQITWLHQLHMKLDAVVVAHGATKFSGSSDSYLVVKTCESRVEAANAVCEIGEGLLEISRKVASIRAIAGHGEVGFGILGSTGWNYQFYGDLIESLKREAQLCTPGKLHKTPELSAFLRGNDENPTASCGQRASEEAMHGGQGMEDMDLVPATFEEWRNRNQQNIEVWVLMITLMLPALAMLGALEKTNSKQEVPIIPSVFQLQCLFVNAYILGIWFVDHGRFIRNHTPFMLIVWTSQLVNRLIGSLLMPLAAERLFRLHPFLRLMAANGPEKLLLASTPVVSGRWSSMLHACGTLSAVIFSARSCSEYSKNKDPVPSECQLPTQIFYVIVNFVLFFLVPVVYSYHCNRKAEKQWNQLKDSKGSKQM